MLRELNDAGKSIGLEIKRSKTQRIRNSWADNGTVHLDNTPIDVVDSYVYLGTDVNASTDLTVELSRRKRAAWASFASIREVTDQLNDPCLRAHLFDCCVLPALTYATESWPTSANINTSIRTTHRALERALLRTSLAKQRRANRNSEDLRAASMLTDPIRFVHGAKHRWAGHVCRTKDDRWTSRATHWFPYDKTRPPGRPPIRWADSLGENVTRFWSAQP